MTEQTTLAPDDFEVESFIAANGTPGVELRIPGLSVLRLPPGAAMAVAGRLAVASVLAETYGLSAPIVPSLADGAVLASIIAPPIEELLRPFLAAGEDGEPVDEKKPDGAANGVDVS